MSKSKNQIKTDLGFTLIEILVAMAIFLIVITTVLQIFMMSMSGTWRLFGRQNDLDTARFILESMSKEVRLSAIISNDSSGGKVQQLNITNAYGCSVSYVFGSSNITRAVTGGSGCTIVSAAPLNPNEVLIVNGGFYIQKPPGSFQPRVTMVMGVKNNAAKAAQQSEVDLQTTISSRAYVQ